MLFSNGVKCINNVLKINDSLIEEVLVTKFLAVFIDNRLTWKDHIVKVCEKLSKSYSVIYKVKNTLNSNALRTLYLTLFLLYLTYCAEIWGVACKIHSDKVKVFQKNIVRIICSVGKREHSQALFHKMRLMKFTDFVVHVQDRLNLVPYDTIGICRKFYNFYYC